ncbi:hypothetical protein ACFVXE_04395 [Streptomyces sp. NPDC058231]|uniref:hypothetical protein n=1 Tax=Streptomyces sp. NPDC058231 TaxID=3346392 RepID=UPI0036EDD980
MTAFRIAPAVVDAFPGTLIAVVTATGLRGHGSWSDTISVRQNLEQQVADGSWQPADSRTPNRPPRTVSAPIGPRSPSEE